MSDEPVAAETEICRLPGCRSTRRVYTYADGTIGVDEARSLEEPCGDSTDGGGHFWQT